MRAPRFIWRSRVLHDLKIAEGSRMLYALLDELAYANGSCVVTQAELADRIGVDVRTIERRLRALQAAGYVTVDRQGPRAARYVLGYAKAVEKCPIRYDTGVGSNGKRYDTGVGSDTTLVSDHFERIKSLGTKVLKSTTLGEGNWSDDERGFAERLRAYPGVRKLPEGPDLAIVRGCLAAHADAREVFGELRRMAHARLEPRESWAWFPVVLSRRLAREQVTELPAAQVMSREITDSEGWRSEDLQWLAENDVDVSQRDRWKEELRRRTA